MELPKYIKEALIKSADLHYKAIKKQKIFEHWLEDNYGEEVLMNDEIRDTLVDWIENSNNPFEAIKLIENDLKHLQKLK